MIDIIVISCMWVCLSGDIVLPFDTLSSQHFHLYLTMLPELVQQPVLRFGTLSRQPFSTDT